MLIFGLVSILIFIGLSVHCLQILAVRSAMRLGENHPPGSRVFPPVSILKPLKGLEDNLMDNLESFCLLDYPEYEVIFSLQDENDPACKVARKVKEKHADKAISIVIEKCRHGLNPKVNNLFASYRIAKYSMILISDSNIMVGPDYLKTIVTPMEDPEVGLVCNLIKGTGGKTLGSIFENLHMNSFVLGNISLLNRYIGVQLVVGKSMLMRKADLNALGGLESFKDILAEDHYMGEMIKKQNQRVVVSNYVINNINEHWDIKKFLSRQIRWEKIRWKIGGIKYFSEFLINSVFISFLSFFLFGLTGKTAFLFLLVCLMRIAGDFYIGKCIPTPVHPLSFLLSPVKDILVGLSWFVPFFDNTVVWRGNRYRIGKATRLYLSKGNGFDWMDGLSEGAGLKSAA